MARPRTDNHSRWKPAHLKSYLTIAEVAAYAGRHPDRIVIWEKRGLIPKPMRVKWGRQSVRLYSPEEAERIKEFFKRVKATPNRKGGIHANDSNP